MRQINMTIYGDNYVGKTKLAQTFPRNVLLTADGNVHKDKNTILSYTINSAGELKKMLAWLEQPEQLQKYDTLIIDGLSKFANMFKKAIADDQGEGKKFRQLGITGWTDLHDIFFDEIVSEGIQKKFGRTHQKNVIIIAHEDCDKNDNNVVVKYALDVSAGNQTAIKHITDITGRLFIKNNPLTGKNIRSLKIDGTPIIAAGNRFFLTDDIDEPSYEKIKELIENYEKGE